VERPSVHALLNLSAAVMLVLGWLAIKGRGPWHAGGPRRDVHRNFMLTALALSAAFLVSYLEYHARVGSVRFWGEGWLRAVYLAVLVPHTILAALMVPMILVTVVAALRDRLERHRAWARWTLPIWLYVSVTGVIIYLMLYTLRPD
jgi:uncharacterized membrane protein YozB (DUF420 family)